MSDHQLLISVADEGIGIPEEKLPQIFNRFYQVEDSDDRTKARNRTGSGIGLTLTRELIEMMDGKISVQSIQGQGSTFTVRLPVRNTSRFIVRETETIRASHRQETNSLLYSDSDSGRNLPLVLVIEDNRDVAAYIQACLEGHYHFELAQDGVLGIERAFDQIPDIIISDVMMPRKDGFEVCQMLKADERTSHIPIILLTAKSDTQSRLEGLGVGADAYLSKPFVREELSIRLANLIEIRQTLQARYARMAVEGNDLPTAGNQREKSLDDLFLEKIKRLVYDHISDPNFGNTELAQHIHLSKSQLFRKLKALTGQSVAIHIRSIRLKRAMELIKNSDMTISEIAYSTGFNDPSYFTRTFSSQFGQSPTQARN